MTIDELKDKSTLELTNHLLELAPAVLDAKAIYNTLARQQRLYVAARELHTDGIWIGDRVRAEGVEAPCQVQLDVDGSVRLQPMIRGKAAGIPLMLWEVGRVEKID